MSLKLDRSKDYDMVESDFLEHILRKFGFPHHIINLIIQCVKIASFSILLNVTPKGPVVPNKGLRYGDSLYTYLSMLCTEGLINLLRQAMIDKILMEI